MTLRNSDAIQTPRPQRYPEAASHLSKLGADQ
jgi:hypothetical protein